MKRNWEDYKPTAIKLVNKFYRSLKEPREDLIQDCYFHFLEVVRIEEEMGFEHPFEAILYTHIKQEFLTLLQGKKYQKRNAILVDFFDFQDSLGTNPFKGFDDYLSLPNELREVVDLILDAPNELIELAKLGSFRDGLTKYLKRYRGWKPHRIRKFWLDFGPVLVER